MIEIYRPIRKQPRKEADRDEIQRRIDAALEASKALRDYIETRPCGLFSLLRFR